MKKDNNKVNIVGIHAVRVLLKVRPFDIYEIYLSDMNSKKFNEIFSEAKKNKITIQKISNEKIFNISNVKSHQGILAVAKKQDNILEKDLIKYLSNKPKNQVLLILDEVVDPRNFGACLRICDAYNISAVVIKDHNSVDINETVRKVAAGSAETIPIVKVKNISRLLKVLKENGLVFQSQVAYLIPIFGVVLGYIFLGEIITDKVIIALVAIILGIYLVKKSTKRIPIKV